MFLPVISLLLLLGEVTGQLLPAFLDCPGNKPKSFFQRTVRQCCESNELPKGCECFSIERKSGYENSLWALPKCPKEIKARFLLYTRSNKASYDVIRTGDNSVANSHFRRGRPVKFITHGFKDEAPGNWSVLMKDAILAAEDVNVILVDWRDGAKITFKVYVSAVANLRTVGAMIARLVMDLVTTNMVSSYKAVHLIGHSLGAQASGMAGKEVKRVTGQLVGRITGLDPAGPRFENYGSRVRLGKNDASFVDVIHTNGKTGGFGIRIDIGQVDFWPNGGQLQPGCPLLRETLDIADLLAACDHMIVLDFFTNSVKSCRYDAGDGCHMGYHADPSKCSAVYKTFTTSAAAPYCGI